MRNVPGQKRHNFKYINVDIIKYANLYIKYIFQGYMTGGKAIEISRKELTTGQIGL